MLVKIERADGETELFNTDSYSIGKAKDFHPLICKVSVFENGKLMKSKSRHFNFIYKHFTFKSEKVQNELKKLAEMSKEVENGNESK